MKRAVLVISLILLSSVAYSQNRPKGELELEQAAKEAAARWTSELAMSAKQTALMEKTLLDYALQMESILNSKMREEAKTQRLLELQLEENKTMQDILTQLQYRRYLHLLEQDVRKDQPNNPTGARSRKK